MYQDNILQYYPHEEGYVRQETNGDFTYVYQCKDHLGNVRLSYADSNGDGVITKAELIEESNYYPFGMQHTGYNSGTLSSNLGQKINTRVRNAKMSWGLTGTALNGVIMIMLLVDFLMLTH